jgi:NADPH:quinone reductase-like Zn-dependent oxidoreductase
VKAIILKQFGGIENFEMVEIEMPGIADDEVLVNIKAISINPVDVKTRLGKRRAELFRKFDPLILGWDISGIVTASKSPLFKPGDEVFGLANFPGHGKAYAEYVAAPAGHLALKPENISHEKAAATTLAALTAWQALVKHAKIIAGQRVLIHSAAGGVGHFAVQLAKHFGAYVIGTSSAANAAFVISLGASEHIDYNARPFEDTLSDIDFVLDTRGGDNIDRSLKVIKKGGTILSIPSGLNESVTEKAKLKGIEGRVMTVESNGDDMKQLAKLLSKDILKPHVSSLFSFEEIGLAHLQVESGKTKGKVIVSI